MKTYMLIAAAILGATLIAGSGQAQKEHKEKQEEATSASSSIHEKAVKLYEMDCAICHNNNGDGKTDIAKDMQLTEDWTKPETLASKSDQELFDTIRKGRNKMPAEVEGRAKDVEVKALIAYIRSFSKGGYKPSAETAATPPAN